MTIHPIAISGAVNAVAATPKHLASTSLDRFVRLHPSYPLPVTAGTQSIAQQKGETTVKVFMKSTPTAIVWDGEIGVELAAVNETSTTGAEGGNSDEDGDDDGVWEGMDTVGAGSDDEESRPTARRRKI